MRDNAASCPFSLLNSSYVFAQCFQEILIDLTFTICNQLYANYSLSIQYVGSVLLGYISNWFRL